VRPSAGACASSDDPPPHAARGVALGSGEPGLPVEVERGRKEASSELLAAICDALEFPLPDLLAEVADSMRPVPLQPLQPLVPIGTRHADLRRATTAPQSVSASQAASPLVSVAA